MKLEKFKKMNQQKKIIISSIIGILLVIGSIVLYRTYALYEEEKEFNVLKGKIPDFGYDIKMLSVVVDGEKSKTIPNRGLYKTQIDCSNGTRGEWDYNAWNLTLENVSENARCNITFTSNLTEEEYNQYIEAGKALRRNTYRGKDITEYHNDGSLYEMISSGRFDDIYVGDYIKSTIDGKEVIWLVADIDNYLQTGDTPLTKHHVTIIPATVMGGGAMNESNTSTNTDSDGNQGYLASKMVIETLPKLLENIKSVFGAHIISYRNLLATKVATDRTSSGSGITNGGATSAWAWVTREIDLMGECNVYGSSIWSSSAFDTGIDNRQYAIFQLKPEYINSYIHPETKVTKRFGYWLKNVSRTVGFASVNDCGNSYDRAATDLPGVRPRLLIG